MSRLVLFVLLSAGIGEAGGCGFSREPGPGDGGVDGSCGAAPAGLATCSNTKARGFEPLGNAAIDSTRASLAEAGAKTAAVWEVAGASAAAPGKLYFALVDNLGAVGNTKLIVDGGVDPVLVRVSGQLNLFWRQGSTLYLQQLDDSGTLLNQPRTVLGGTTDAFAVAWNGSEFGMLLSGANQDLYQVYWLRLNGDGTVAAGPTKLPQAGVNSIQPALAWTGCNYAAAWTDTRAGTPAVYYARLARDFSHLGDDLMLSQAGVRGSYPSLAAQPTGGVVVCYEALVTPPMNQEIFCNRLDDTGVVTATQQLSKTPEPSQNPYVVAAGQNTWVLWDDYLKSPSAPSVVWQFLDAAGAPILSAPKVDPDIAAGGWRAHGFIRSDDASALYFLQYYGDPQTNAFTAQIVTENCY